MPKIRIKIVGVGGAGGRIVTGMKDCSLPRTKILAINTDLQALEQCQGIETIPIGENITYGLGAGMNPKIGEKAAKAQKEELERIFQKTELILLVGGLGGGTASGALPVMAEMARKTGALVIGVVLKPFGFEGGPRMRVAQAAIKKLKPKVNALAVIFNKNLLKYVARTPFLKFAKFSRGIEVINTIVQQGIQGMVELITSPGLINLDLPNIKRIIGKEGNLILLGVGLGKGNNRAVRAAKRAVTSPLLNASLMEAKKILLNISGKNLEMSEIDKIFKIIKKNASPTTKITSGLRESGDLEGQVKVTLFATLLAERRQELDKESERL